MRMLEHVNYILAVLGWGSPFYCILCHSEETLDPKKYRRNVVVSLNCLCRHLVCMECAHRGWFKQLAAETEAALLLQADQKPRCPACRVEFQSHAFVKAYTLLWSRGQELERLYKQLRYHFVAPVAMKDVLEVVVIPYILDPVRRKYMKQDPLKQQLAAMERGDNNAVKNRRKWLHFVESRSSLKRSIAAEWALIGTFNKIPDLVSWPHYFEKGIKGEGRYGYIMYLRFVWRSLLDLLQEEEE